MSLSSVYSITFLEISFSFPVVSKMDGFPSAGFEKKTPSVRKRSMSTFSKYEGDVAGEATRRVMMISHEACPLHHIRHHPEQPRRVQRIERAVLAAKFDSLVVESNAPEATRDSLQMFHTKAHVERILEM